MLIARATTKPEAFFVYVYLLRLTISLPTQFEQNLWEHCKINRLIYDIELSLCVQFYSMCVLIENEYLAIPGFLKLCFHPTGTNP